MNKKEMPVINNPEKQKNLINKKGQYEIDFPENPTDNSQMKYIDRDSYFTEESFERLKPKIGVNLDEEYNTEENLLEKEESDIEKNWLKEEKNDIKKSISEEKKHTEEIKKSKIFKELTGKDLSYEEKEKIVQTYEKISNLKSSIKRIIFEIFEELYGDNKTINIETPDIKYVWDIVLKTRESSPEYVQNILEYLNANKILGCCIKKLRDGQLKEVYEKLKSLYRSGSNSKELITNYKEYEEMLKILES